MNPAPDPQLVCIPHPCGGHLYGLVHWPVNPRAFAVLYVHGLGGSAGGEKSMALLAACSSRGWPFAAFDFRGHGQSCGTMRDLRCGGLLEDLAVVRQYLQARGIERLFPIGSSMGGWAVSWFALQNPDVVHACVLLAPAFHFPTGLWDRLTENEKCAWQQSGILRLKNQWIDIELAHELIEGARNYPLDDLQTDWCTPALILHGMRDDLIPARKILTALEAIDFPDIELRLFRSGGHRLTEFKEEIADASCRFVERRLGHCDSAQDR